MHWQDCGAPKAVHGRMSWTNRYYSYSARHIYIPPLGIPIGLGRHTGGGAVESWTRVPAVSSRRIFSPFSPGGSRVRCVCGSVKFLRFLDTTMISTPTIPGHARREYTQSTVQTNRRGTAPEPHRPGNQACGTRYECWTGSTSSLSSALNGHLHPQGQSGR